MLMLSFPILARIMHIRVIHPSESLVASSVRDENWLMQWKYQTISTMHQWLWMPLKFTFWSICIHVQNRINRNGMQVMMHADCPMFGTSVTRFKVDNLSCVWQDLGIVSNISNRTDIHILDDRSHYVIVRCGKGIGRVVIGERPMFEKFGGSEHCSGQDERRRRRQRDDAVSRHRHWLLQLSPSPSSTSTTKAQTVYSLHALNLKRLILATSF